MLLISCSPVLKDLLIHRVLKNNVPNCDLCISLLTSAELSFRLTADGTKVEIDAPIKHLRIVHFNPTHSVSVKDPGNLITAEVRMHVIESSDCQGEQKDNVFKFMNMLEKVERLSLEGYTTNVIGANQIELPMFLNLTRLELVVDCKDLSALQCLINNSNKLQTLVMKELYLCCMDDEQWMEFLEVPKCLVTSLKCVEIDNFDCCKHRLGMIENILKCAQVLKRLAIGYDEYRSIPKEVTTSMSQKISTFPRASALCEVEFPPHRRRIDSEVSFPD